MKGSGAAYSQLKFNEEKRVISKVSLRLIPLLSWLYLICFLDRANLGNAHLTMIQDLNMSETQYAACVAVFYVGYVLSEVPSNCILEIVAARRWIARIMLTWGIVSLLMAFASGFYSLLLLRFLLGVAEAGFFPGILYYFTLWFNHEQQASRISLLSSSSALAGLVGGVLAYGILHMDGVLGLKGWQWIFIIEAIPPIVMFGVVLVYLPDDPRSATWLTEDERELVIQRAGHRASRPQSNDDAAAGPAAWPRFKSLFVSYIHETAEIFRFPSTWLFASICFCILVTMQSASIFLPAIVADFEKGPIISNLWSSVPYFFAVILLNVNAFHSDKTNERPLHIVAMCCIGVVGYFLCGLAFMASWRSELRMVALTIGVAGGWSAMTPFMAWVSANSQGNKAASIAAINGLGSIAGFVAPFIQSTCKNYTGNYTLGLVLLGGFLLIGIVLVLLARFLFKDFLDANRRRGSRPEMEFALLSTASTSEPTEKTEKAVIY